MSNPIAKKYISEFVYGATDGTITTFAIVSGVVGASLSPAVILLLGLSNVFADGFSMAASNYLSKQAERGVSDAEQVNPLKSALATFVSFIVVGMVPITPFIIGIFTPITPVEQFEYSVIATACAFLLTGYLRGRVTGENKLVAALETLAIGGIAAAIAYYVGFFLKGIV